MPGNDFAGVVVAMHKDGPQELQVDDSVAHVRSWSQVAKERGEQPVIPGTGGAYSQYTV